MLNRFKFDWGQFIQFYAFLITLCLCRATGIQHPHHIVIKGIQHIFSHDGIMETVP